MKDASTGSFWRWLPLEVVIAVVTLTMIGVHLLLRFVAESPDQQVPLLVALIFGGVPLVGQLLVKVYHRDFGSDLLAGISIVTSVILGEYLAGSLVVLMLSGGEALEAFAVRSASSVLGALAKRMPSIAHRRRGDTSTTIEDISLAEVRVGDLLVVLPHEICPIDGTVVEGRGVMDESYLTGEPYMMSKMPGSSVLSGAVNGDSALTVRADKLAVDSRYAKIMQVMQSSEQQRPRLRRLGDQLGAVYTPLAVGLGLLAWMLSGDSVRFLAVLVVATPCPLLIAIPVAIIGSISLAAKHAIIVRDPAVLETVDTCRTVIFDKTGTLTYGEPELVENFCAPGVDYRQLLTLVASLEAYSKHPLAEAILQAAKRERVEAFDVSEISEPPGKGLTGVVAGKRVTVTGRQHLLNAQPEAASLLPPPAGGLECVVLVDGVYQATLRFRDTPRSEGASFIHHLSPKHQISRILLVSGDRESEVRYLADKVGIKHVHFSQSPEEKVEIVRAERKQAPTMFVGDGINDAPALMEATVGVAFGQNSDVTTEAADVVVLDTSLQKIDEFMHISRRMRRIALQSAIGGMALSLVGMLVAAAGYLPPVAGAVAQEIIDVVAVLNALRVAVVPKTLRDFEGESPT